VDYDQRKRFSEGRVSFLREGIFMDTIKQNIEITTVARTKHAE
jgi:hypothetical protein